MREAVAAFNKFASKDSPSKLMQFLKEENEKSRQHEKTMLEMQMKMFQTMVASFGLQQQGNMAQQQQASFGTRQTQGFPNNDMFRFTNGNNNSHPEGSYENVQPRINGWMDFENRDDGQQKF